MTRGVVRPATHVKLDVDGNELLVLRGMRALLGSDRRPRTLQVEISVRHKEELLAYVAGIGYELAEKHFTMLGKKQLAAGADPESLPYNAVFRARCAA